MLQRGRRAALELQVLQSQRKLLLKITEKTADCFLYKMVLEILHCTALADMWLEQKLDQMLT